MIEKVQKTIQKHSMLKPGDRVLVAVSGGVDSMTLLRVLYELRKEWKLWLAVAHLDHRMRRDSEEDARFVKDYAALLKLPCVQESIDVPAYVRAEKRSLEEGARQMRYRFLARAAHELDTPVIALGHNLDDQVETFFLHLLRGSGLAGLAGIPPVRREDKLQYIRPLIECSRSEIVSFARLRKIEYREDPTNRDKTFLRNRLRSELLPLLREYNPNVLETVARVEEMARKANEYLVSVAMKVLRQVEGHKDPHEIVLDKQKLLSQEEVIQEYVLREAIRKVQGHLQGIEAAHIESMLRELRKRRSGTQVILPSGIRFATQSRRVRITRKPPKAHRAPYRFELQRGAKNQFEEIRWSFELSVREGSHPEPEDHLEARIDCDTITEPLYIRNWKRGDRFEPLGLGGTKKLQDVFVDAHIPIEERDEIPLVCDQNGILWVVGLRVSERCRVTSHTRRTLFVRAIPLKEE